MTYTSTISDSPVDLITHAIPRVGSSPHHRPPEAFSLAHPKPEPEPRAATVSDEATLSHTSLLLAHALNHSGSDSNADIRTETIAALQYTIAADTYHVSSADVAGKLIQFLQTWPSLL